MRLSKIHVTNFRSVEDSTEFNVGQVLTVDGGLSLGAAGVG